MLSQRESTVCSDGVGGGSNTAIGDCSGQGTVEYAIVLFAFLSLVAGLGAMWHAFDAGLLVEHALQSASHHVASAAPGAFVDVFMY